MDAGTEISGFRIERPLPTGSLGVVYESTQLSLGRVVALRLLDREALAGPGTSVRFHAQQRLSASVHHPNVVPMYEAGTWEGGEFVATRFVRGRALADLLDRSPSSQRLGAIAEQITGALEAAHDAGLTHGRLTAQNVLVDAAGRAYLADLGLGRRGTVAADREALAVLVADIERAGAARGRRRRRIVAATVATTTLATVAAVFLLGRGSESEDGLTSGPPPAVAAGALPRGSDLAPGATASMGCSEEPGPNTPVCTLIQTTIAGRSTRVQRAGTIRAWAVRGAAGDLTLQVIGRRNGKASLVGFSQVERVLDRGPHAFETNVRVERGDRIGVELAPEATIGFRATSGRTSALRSEGTTELAPTQPQSVSRFDGELLLRTDIEGGAQPELAQLTGPAAAGEPVGTALEQQQVVIPGGVVRVELVRAGGVIAIDAFRRHRRLARVDVADADPGGRLLSLQSACGYRRGFCLSWLNPGEETSVVHAYRLIRGGAVFSLIG